MNIDEVLVLVEQALLNRGLSPIERLVLQQSWLGHSYNEIAENSSYVSGYIKEVGSQLWQEISDRVGDRVTKKNLQLVLRDYCDCCNSVDTENSPTSFPTVLELPEPSEILFPGTPLTAYSPFYIPRPAIEVPILKTLQQSGCAIRIKGSQNMGKTSLLNYILNRAAALNYRTVAIDLQEAEKSIFASLDRYLRWFCAHVSRQLGLAPRQDEYWNLDLGSKISCKIYFEAYLLPQINTPMAIALDEVHRLFDYPEIAQEFLPMLRSWHEQAQRLEAWQKLRLIIAYTSEFSRLFQFNQSLFNVGIIVTLPPLTLNQMQDLAHCYGLPNPAGEEGLNRLAPLAAMVGGHPYLVHIAFYHLRRGQMNLIDLLNQAPTPSGIYSDHLRYYLALVKSDPSLIETLRTIIADERETPLDAIAVYKLESMGLVHLDGHQAQFSCDLYRLYFSQQLETTKPPPDIPIPPQITTENHFDLLTKLLNRQYFQQYLNTQWQQWQDQNNHISAILCEIDYFQVYNRVHGQQAGDRCLQEVARTLKLIFSPQATLIARYSGLCFVALFLNFDLDITLSLAEQGRLAVRDLAIPYDHPNLGLGGFHSPILTTSLGVVRLTIQPQDTPSTFINQLEQSLYRAKRSGRDCVETY